MRATRTFLRAICLLSTCIGCGTKGAEDGAPSANPDDDAGVGSGGTSGSGAAPSGGAAGSGARHDAAAGASDGAAGHAGGGEWDSGGIEACGEEPGDAGGDGAALTAPLRMIPGAAIPVGVTSDGYAVYRLHPKLSAVKLAPSAAAVDISAQPGNAVIRGKTVFFWANVDYAKGRGDLSIWSAPNCSRKLENTLDAEDLVAASADGSRILYPANVTDTTLDVVVATRDLTRRHTLVAGAGRGSMTTCRPRYGFSGDRVIVGSCAPGSLDARVSAWNWDGTSWTETQVAEQAQSDWTADTRGERVVYLTNASQGRLWLGAERLEIDDGIGWARMLADGSALFYTVGDQLRRTGLPEIVPIPIITNKFRNLAAFSPDHAHVLYSSAVVYEGIERRDLLLTATTSFNPAPLKLVATPEARLSRSAFTADSGYALYLDQLSPAGSGTLHVRALASGSELTLPDVDTAVAARGSLIVLSDGRSDPAQYPIVAQLKLLDASSGAAATLLEARVFDGRSFYVTADGRAVVYSRPRDAAAPPADVEGLWLHPLP